MIEDRHAPFGADRFGRAAEAAARFFGTPHYIVGQTLLVAVWIAINSIAVVRHWDPYPFILLNLVFSTQAAYAAPLILLAQTRQAERDRLQAEKTENHREEVARESLRREQKLERLTTELQRALDDNTAVTREIRDRLGDS